MDLEAREHEARPLLGNFDNNKLATVASKQEAYLASILFMGLLFFVNRFLYWHSLIVIFFAASFVLVSLWAMQNYKQMWRQRLAKLTLMAAACGLLTGCSIYYSCTIYYFHYKHASTYASVLFKTSMVSFAEAWCSPFRHQAEALEVLMEIVGQMAALASANAAGKAIDDGLTLSAAEAAATAAADAIKGGKSSGEAAAAGEAVAAVTQGDRTGRAANDKQQIVIHIHQAEQKPEIKVSQNTYATPAAAAASQNAEQEKDSAEEHQQRQTPAEDIDKPEAKQEAKKQLKEGARGKTIDKFEAKHKEEEPSKERDQAEADGEKSSAVSSNESEVKQNEKVKTEPAMKGNQTNQTGSEYTQATRSGDDTKPPTKPESDSGGSKLKTEVGKPKASNSSAAETTKSRVPIPAFSWPFGNSTSNSTDVEEASSGILDGIKDFFDNLFGDNATESDNSTVAAIQRNQSISAW
eukprot:g10114.t1